MQICFMSSARVLPCCSGGAAHSDLERCGWRCICPVRCSHGQLWRASRHLGQQGCDHSVKDNTFKVRAHAALRGVGGLLLVSSTACGSPPSRVETRHVPQAWQSKLHL